MINYLYGEKRISTFLLNPPSGFPPVFNLYVAKCRFQIILFDLDKVFLVYPGFCFIISVSIGNNSYTEFTYASIIFAALSGPPNALSI
jgi:hypothetical protein